MAGDKYLDVARLGEDSLEGKVEGIHALAGVGVASFIIFVGLGIGAGFFLGVATVVGLTMRKRAKTGQNLKTELPENLIPLQLDAAGYQSRALFRDDLGRLGIKEAAAGWIGILMGAVGGVTLFGLCLLHILQPGKWTLFSNNEVLRGLGASSLILIILAGVGKKLADSKVVFDKRRGVFWVGREEEISKFKADLKDIDRLQVLRKQVNGWRGCFEALELNIVLKTGTRINLMNQIVGARAQDAVRELSETLGKRVDYCEGVLKYRKFAEEWVLREGSARKD
jgi:hypothetical protein